MAAAAFPAEHLELPTVVAVPHRIGFVPGEPLGIVRDVRPQLENKISERVLDEPKALLRPGGIEFVRDREAGCDFFKTGDKLLRLRDARIVLQRLGGRRGMQSLP